LKLNCDELAFTLLFTVAPLHHGGYPGIYSPVHKHLTFIRKAAFLQAAVFGEAISDGSGRLGVACASILVGVLLFFT
jgi:hypothetical protein